MTNNYIIPLFIAGTALAMVMLSFMIGYLFVQKNKQNAYVRGILQARLDENDKTLQRVSTELHDNVVQLLSVASMYVKFVQDSVTGQQKEYITTAVNRLDDALRDVRHISHSLSSEHIKAKGLATAIQDELNLIKSVSELECRLEVEGDSYKMPPETELSVFRILQESINNTIKHAEATSVQVELKYTPGLFQFVFSDNGKGFPVEQIGQQGGIGLNNMQERARHINGDMQFSNRPEGGARIKLNIPITQEENKQPAKR